MDIYKGIIMFRETSMKNSTFFHEHERKCSRSTLTCPMHNFPITSLFEKLFRHKRQVNIFVFLIFNFFVCFTQQLRKIRKENKNYLVRKANKHTREYQPHAIAPRQRRHKSFLLPLEHCVGFPLKRKG